MVLIFLLSYTIKEIFFSFFGVIFQPLLTEPQALFMKFPTHD